MISRRMRRALKEELELVTYLVTSENESHRVEELGRPGGPYYGLGNLVDLEVEVRSYLAKDGQVQLTLRSVRVPRVSSEERRRGTFPGNTAMR